MEALRVVFPRLEEVRAFDINAGTLERYAKHVEEVHGVHVKKAKGPRQAVVGSDIIVTAGPILKHPKPVIEASFGLGLSLGTGDEGGAPQGSSLGQRVFLTDVALGVRLVLSVSDLDAADTEYRRLVDAKLRGKGEW